MIINGNNKQYQNIVDERIHSLAFRIAYCVSFFARVSFFVFVALFLDFVKCAACFRYPKLWVRIVRS
jgi:hypothetical protein